MTSRSQKRSPPAPQASQVPSLPTRGSHGRNHGRCCPSARTPLASRSPSPVSRAGVAVSQLELGSTRSRSVGAVSRSGTPVYRGGQGGKRQRKVSNFPSFRIQVGIALGCRYHLLCCGPFTLICPKVMSKFCLVEEKTGPPERLIEKID